MSKPEVILGKMLTEQEEWLAHIVRKQERDRIINLLENRLLTNQQPDIETDRLGSFSHAMHNQLIRNLMALIKADN